MSKRSLKRAILAAKKVTSQEPVPQRFQSFSAHLEDWEKSGASQRRHEEVEVSERGNAHDRLFGEDTCAICDKAGPGAWYTFEDHAAGLHKSK